MSSLRDSGDGGVASLRLLFRAGDKNFVRNDDEDVVFFLFSVGLVVVGLSSIAVG